MSHKNRTSLGVAEADALDKKCRSRWIGRLMAKGFRPHRIRREISAINALLSHTRKRPWELSPSDLKAWLEHLRQDRSMSAAALRCSHSAVLRFLDYFFHADFLQSHWSGDADSTLLALEKLAPTHLGPVEDGGSHHGEQMPSATSWMDSLLSRSRIVDFVAPKSPRKASRRPANRSTKGYCRELSAEQTRRIREWLSSCRKESD